MEAKTKELIEKTRALLAKGSRKPWRRARKEGIPKAIVPLHGAPENIFGTDQEGYAIVSKEADCELIVQAPDLLEALCDALEKAHS